jgi:alpha-amylase/alpha-mannosidase (GH57 family)
VTTSLVIHGHFYQPPRENPWTEVIEPEPSAQPFHDWNERIYQECYRANGNARIVSSGGRMEAIENNYLFLSFNFGPTLLSWMQLQHPRGFERIMEADKESVALRGGHGNAIAQGYNHCILPLCNERDCVTQIRWGLREFRHRYGREAESMWLPETACNDAVLGRCIDEGLRYIILAPSQCGRVRPIGGKEWTLTEGGNVDPGRAYRYTHKDGSGRTIVLFFYDGPIARSLAFGEGLRSSQELIGVISRAEKGDTRIVNVATDGESYGHHTKWGDRTLAYALKHEASAQDYLITNYGEYLDRCPPVWEAEIKSGPDGEGTAWSCAHGVGRWIRDCGCQTGAKEGWNQAWRTPLRKALDELRDYAVTCFEEGASSLLRNPWAARNEFIAVLLDPSHDSRSRFLALHAARPLSEAEQVRALAMLDMQRQAMLMYTSCGWFFNEISGIETVQILKYACRLMDDLSELGYKPPRKEFLAILGQAQSNIPEMGNGADIFRSLVEPSKVGLDRLSAHLAISSLVEEPEPGNFGCHDFQFLNVRKDHLGKTSLSTGRIRLENRLTGRLYDCMFAAAHLGGIDFHCCIANYDSEEALEESARRVAAEFRKGLIPPLLRAMREEFGVREFGLENLLAGQRERIAKAVFAHLIQDLSEEYRHVYQENRRYLEMFQAAGFSLPPELRTAAEYTLSRQFEEEIRAQRLSHDPEAYQEAVRIVEDAGRQGLSLDRSVANDLFGGMITDAVRLAMESPDSSHLTRAISLIKLTRQLGIQPNLDLAQEIAVRSHDQLHNPDDLAKLANLLYLAPELLVRSNKES